MKRIAVIGSGISGMAAAYYLSRKHEVWLYEKDSRLGGHTHTVPVGDLNIDTGFIVHNRATYPNLVKLFEELGVATMPSDMSFSVSDSRTGFEYSSRGLNGFFARRSHLFSPGHYKLLSEIIRFNKAAPALLSQPGAENVLMGDFLAEGKFHEVLLERYLYPMAAAVWSMPCDSIARFPALTMLRFFQNHGMLGINTHPQWLVVTGGSNRYIEPLTEPFRKRIMLNAGIQKVVRAEDRVTLHFAERPAERFDEVVFACHGNQVMPLLESPSDRERDVLSNFQTSTNDTVLHTDLALLPRRDRARASWNYNLAGSGGATLTYYMNRLQSLPADTDYCVTLNGTASIDPKKILKRLTYNHPIYSLTAIRAQERWKEISGHDRTHYCGAYWFYGFHEDGLNSALRVAESIS